MIQKPSDIEEKQNFLRKEVIEKGYSAEDFLDFLVSKKADGGDINSWTFSQLTNLVNQYKTRSTESGFNKRLSEIINDEEVESTGRETFDALKQPRVEYEKYNLFDMPFKKLVESVPFKPFLEREHATPEIIVEKPQLKVSGGFFFGIGRTCELWYTVRSNVVPGTAVRRTESDITWLHDTLVKLYPSASIPPYGKYAGDLEKEDPRSLDRRGRMAGYFLTSAAQNELLYNSKLFMAFLTWTDYNKFTEFRNNVERLPGPKSINHIPTKDGLVQLEISSRNRTAVRAGEAYLNAVGQIYEKLDISVHSVMRDLDTLSISVGKVGNDFASLQQQYSNMVIYSPDTKNEALSNIFISLSSVCTQWSRSLKQYRRSMIDHISLLFRYTRQQNQSFLQMFKHRSQHQQDYLQFKANLINRKLKVYNESDKWDIPADKLNQPNLSKDNIIELLLPKETEIENRKKEWQSFLNKTCEKEFKRFNKVNAWRLGAVFNRMGQEMSTSCSKELAVMNRLTKLSQKVK